MKYSARRRGACIGAIIALRGRKEYQYKTAHNSAFAAGGAVDTPHAYLGRNWPEYRQAVVIDGRPGDSAYRRAVRRKGAKTEYAADVGITTSPDRTLSRANRLDLRPRFCTRLYSRLLPLC